MGVDIRSNHKGSSSYTVGAGIFANLRKTVAKIILKDRFHTFTEWLATDDDTPKEELHNKCYALYKAGGDALYNFVCSSDIEGKLSPKQAKELYQKLTAENLDDYDFSLCYYAYRKPESRLDFINLLKDCVDHRCGFKWY